MSAEVYPPFTCTFSPQIPELLHNLQCTLAFTTFQAGKLVLLSAKNESELMQLPRTFDKPTGLAVNDDKLALCTKDEIIIFKASASIAQGYPQKPGVYDRMFIPVVSYHTGQADLHDIAWLGDELVAVNTSFSCLVKPSSEFHFEPVWQPPFISKLASEDRCHLNGLAVVNGKVKYVTAFSDSDQRLGWSDHIPESGILMDVEREEIIVSDLQMPHSPRWFDDKLYALQSALGTLMQIDTQSGEVKVIYQQDGFARGLAKFKDYLFVGYSKLRQNSSSFAKLQFSEKAIHCGISIIHEPTSAYVGEIRYLSSIDEIFDIQIIPDTTRANILNTHSQDYKSALIIPGASYWGRNDPGRP